MWSPALALLVYLLWGLQSVDCLQQIYYKSLNETADDNPVDVTYDVTYDPSRGIYPVVQLSTDCPYYNVTHCKVEAIHTQTFNKYCDPESLCPNGTQPQCVENKDVLKQILWICSPIGPCDRNARSIVYVDPTRPNIYQLGKEACEDGFYHSTSTNLRDNYCFSRCKENVRIRVHRKSTENRGPIVYCNYPMGYCNAELPKLFELEDVLSPCYLADMHGYKTCPAWHQRMYDCQCNETCPDGYMRNPGKDFKCERRSDVFAAEDKRYLQNTVHISQFSSGFRVKWDFPHSDSVSVETVMVAYRETSGSRMTNRNHTVSSDNTSNFTDIEDLFPGKNYTIVVRIVYKYKGKLRTYPITHIEPTRPLPVDNLTARLDKSKINLHWDAPNESLQDHYSVESRMVRRNRKPSWTQNASYNCTYTLHDPFPGEEYEFRVRSVSSGISSAMKATGLIVPPLSPPRLQYDILSSNVVNIYWSHDENQSHVEKYSVQYNSSSGSDRQTIEVSLPDHGNRLQATLYNLQRGQSYTASVESSVANVTSNEPANITFKVPDAEGIPTYVYILTVIVSLIAIGVCVVIVVICRTKAAPAPVHNSYRYQIDKVHNEFCANGDVNVTGPLLPDTELNNNTTS